MLRGIFTTSSFVAVISAVVIIIAVEAAVHTHSVITVKLVGMTWC